MAAAGAGVREQEDCGPHKHSEEETGALVMAKLEYSESV